MKRRLLSLAAIVGFVLLLFTVLATAQPVTSGGGLSRVQTTGGALAGSGTTTNPLKVRSDCTDGQVLKSTTGVWSCAADAGGVSGTGTSNVMSKWTGASSLGDSTVTDNGTTLSSTVTGGLELPAGYVWAQDGWATNTGGPGVVGVDQHNVTLAPVLEFSPSAANVNVTGVTGGNSTDPLIVRYLTVRNSAVSGNTITLIHESASSTAANRFNLPSAANLSIGQRASFGFIYNSAIDRWELNGSPGGGVSDGDKTDITVSASGATWNIDSATVDIAEIVDNINFTSNGAITTGDTRGTELSPASISGTINDWAPASLSTAKIVYITASPAAIMNGMTGGVAGRQLTMCAVGTNEITFNNENAGSVAANRFRLPAATNWVLYAPAYWAANGMECMEFTYNGTLSRWVLSSTAVSSVPKFEVTGAFFASSTSSHTGTATFTGDIVANGSTTIGNANTDTLTVTAKVDSNVHYGGTAPTLGAGCGTGAVCIGSVCNSRRGAIDLGTSATGACLVTFAVAYTTNAPVCVASTKIGTIQITTPSTTAVTFTTSDFTSENIIYYHCDGVL